MSAQELRVGDLAGRRPTVDSATRTVVRLMGAVAAFAGAEHGVGEVTQVDPQVGSLVIESWPHVAAFESLGGEPAMTLVPDLRVAGVITVLVSLSMGWWALRTRAAHRDGWVLLGFSCLLLLVGGGFGPPLVGMVLALALLRPVSAARHDRPTGAVRSALGRRWQQLLVLTVGAFLALVPGVVLVALAGIETVWLAATLPIVAFTGLLLTLVAARAHDGQHADHQREGE